MKSLFIKQFVDEGLGNSSYLIASEETGVAAVIDPQRDVDKYLQTADGLGLNLILRARFTSSRRFCVWGA
jgi:glyoxylase-like metal-dependent hydrolase (beta-lactamase superfamily II)